VTLCLAVGLTIAASLYTTSILAHSHTAASAQPDPAIAPQPQLALTEADLNYKSYLPTVRNELSNCEPTGGSGGLAPGSHRTTIAGLNAVVVVGDGYNPQIPTYLGFHIHGDSGNIYQFEKETHVVNQFIRSNGWIFVAPESPNGGQSWWSNKVGDHNALFAAVMDHMFSRYNVCRYTVFGSMGSGGSEFWTAQFFPFEGEHYPAHSVVSCGGNDGNSAARNNVRNMGRNPHIVEHSTFFYVYGTEDRLFDLIQQSIELYSSAGFNVRIDEIQGAGHCDKWKKAGLPTQMDQIVAKWTILAGDLNVDVH
jgi:hypothetical protein